MSLLWVRCRSNVRVIDLGGKMNHWKFAGVLLWVAGLVGSVGSGIARADVFLYSSGTFSTVNINLPNVSTGGINSNGQFVGSYDSGGFLYSSGVVTPIDLPGGLRTTLTGINDLGEITGTNVSTAFLYNSGSFSKLTVPGGVGTTPEGINDHGQVVGETEVPYGVGSKFEGFEYSGGTYTIFDLGQPLLGNPAADTDLVGINDSGDILARVCLPFDFHKPCQNFLYSGGVYTPLTTLNSLAAFVTGINDNDQIVGYGTPNGGFLYSYKTGTLTYLDDPNGAPPGDTSPSGISNNGLIVGAFAPPVSPPSVPEPRTAPVLGVCVAFVLAAASRHFRRRMGD
jgi:uncharacterized membrane protein